MKKKLSVFIVPDSGDVRQFSLTKPLIFAALAGIIVYLGLSVGFSYGFFTTKIEAHKIDELTRENQFLTAKIDEFNQSIEGLQVELAVLTEKEKAIRTIFELPEIDPAERQLGIGGPNMLPMEEEIVPSRVSAYQSEAELDRLLAVTEFEKEQFDDVYQALLDKKADLDHTPSIMPTKGWLTRGYGTKRDPFTGEQKLHAGIDVSNRIGTPILATADGQIIQVERQRGLGKMIRIDHGNGFVTVYGHLSEFKVKKGQRVKRGEVIALMGNTGYSTGPHLHYEIFKDGKTINPMSHVVTYANNN